MTNAHQPDRLDRIEAILAQVATAQQANTTAISELRQENARANAELRQSIADLRQENAEANAELRREIKANIDNVSAMIFDGLAETKKITDSNARAIQAWEQRLETERDETITVEVDTFNAIDGLRTDVQSLTNFVRDGFNMLGQVIVGLRQELSAQIQSLIDITRDNTGRITRLEDENPGSS